MHQAGTAAEVIVVELDLEYVRRCRRAGWHGLGQPLKSFRDSTVEFPAHAAAGRRSAYLESLGPLAMPAR